MGDNVKATSIHLSCGQEGTYKELKKSKNHPNGDPKYDRDHIPSKQALIERARELAKPKRLSDAASKAIAERAWTIAIPKAAHRRISPTYGGRNNQIIAGIGENAVGSSRSKADAKDLAKAANRDIDAMEAEGANHGMDQDCMKKYRKATKKIRQRKNSDYDKFLNDIIDEF